MARRTGIITACVVLILTAPVSAHEEEPSILEQGGLIQMIAESAQAADNELLMLAPEQLQAANADVNTDGVVDEDDLTAWRSQSVPFEFAEPIEGGGEVIFPEPEGECPDLDVSQITPPPGVLVTQYEYVGALDVNSDGYVNILDQHLLEQAVAKALIQQGSILQINGENILPIYRPVHLKDGVLTTATAQMVNLVASAGVTVPGGTLASTPIIVPDGGGVTGGDIEEDECDHEEFTEDWNPAPIQPGSLDRDFAILFENPCCCPVDGIIPTYDEVFQPTAYDGKLKITQGHHSTLDPINRSCNDVGPFARTHTISHTAGTTLSTQFQGMIPGVYTAGLTFGQSSSTTTSDAFLFSCTSEFNESRTCHARFISFNVTASLTPITGDFGPPGCTMCEDMHSGSWSVTIDTFENQSRSTGKRVCECPDAN